MKTNVLVRIMGSDFQLACDVSEREVLIRSADILNQHLKEFRRKNSSLDAEKLLLTGALGITCELLKENDRLSQQASLANTELKKVLNDLQPENQSK